MSGEQKREQETRKDTAGDSRSSEPPYVSADEIKSIKYEIDKLRKRHTLAIGNGLYDSQTLVQAEGEINDSLRLAEEILQERGDIVRAKYMLGIAESLFYHAINSTSLSWRLKNIHALHLFPYVPAVIGAIIIFYLSGLPLAFTTGHFLGYETPLNISIAAVNAVVWGVIGALFQDIWYLWLYVNTREYEVTWQVKFFLAPIVGGIIGGAIYLLIAAGLLVLSADANSDQPRDLVVYIVCFFAGYKWEWAIKRLEGVGEKFGS